MNPTVDNDLLTFSREELKDIFKESIKAKVTEILRSSINVTEVANCITSALTRRTFAVHEQKSFINKIVDEGFGWAMESAIRTAVKDSGLEQMLAEKAAQYMQTQEFQDELNKRVKETVFSTVFYVKPK